MPLAANITIFGKSEEQTNPRIKQQENEIAALKKQLDAQEKYSHDLVDANKWAVKERFHAISKIEDSDVRTEQRKICKLIQKQTRHDLHQAHKTKH